MWPMARLNMLIVTIKVSKIWSPLANGSCFHGEAITVSLDLRSCCPLAPPLGRSAGYQTPHTSRSARVLFGGLDRYIHHGDARENHPATDPGHPPGARRTGEEETRARCKYIPRHFSAQRVSRQVFKHEETQLTVKLHFFWRLHFCELRPR